MCQTRDKVFQAPQIERIQKRLSEFNNLLELNTGESVIALRKLLGPMKLEVQHPEIGKPYYGAHSSINVLAITEPLPNSKILDNGSTHSNGGRGRNVSEPWLNYFSGQTSCKFVKTYYLISGSLLANN